MKKPEFIELMVAHSGLTKVQIKKALKTLIKIIQDSLEKGETVSLSGLGSFRVKACKEKLGRNPKTGDTVPVPAGKKISFKPTVKLKKIIRK